MSLEIVIKILRLFVQRDWKAKFGNASEIGLLLRIETETSTIFNLAVHVSFTCSYQ